MKFTGLLIIGLLILTSCSPKNNNPEAPPPQVELAATSANVEFGIFKSTGSSKLLSATIYNDTGSTISGPATISNSDFSFVSGFNCPAGAKNKASCPTLKLSFNPQGKNPGEYNATLNLGSISVPLHATIESPVITTPEDLAALITSSLGDSVDYGTMLSSGSTIIKTIVLTNGSSQSLNLPIVKTNIGPFLVSYDTCSNKPIAKNGTCQLKVSFSPGSLSGNQSGSISYSGHVINFAASVVTPESVSQSGTPAVIGGISYSPNIQFFVGSTVSSSYQFPNGVKTVTLTVKNTGNLASTASTLTLTGSSDYSLVSNTCVSKSLSPNATCSVKVILSGSSQPTASVTMNNVSLALSVASPPGNVQLTVVKSGIGSISDGNSLLCGDSCSTQTVTYPVGTIINLVSTPGNGYVVGSYSGGSCSGLSPICQITLSSNTTVTVGFLQELNLLASKKIRINQLFTISPIHGLSPYVITKLNGVGSLEGDVYSAGSIPGSSTIQVQDQLGSVKILNITVSILDGTQIIASALTSPVPEGYNSYNTPITVLLNDNSMMYISSYNSNGNHLFMSKYNSMGILDSSFGNNGFLDLSKPGQASGAVLLNNDLYIYGTNSDGFSSYTNVPGFIRKYSLSGVLDSSFGVNGELNYNIPTNTNYTTINSLVSDGNSLIFVAQCYVDGYANVEKIIKSSMSGNIEKEVEITGAGSNPNEPLKMGNGKIALFYKIDNNDPLRIKMYDMELNADSSFNSGNELSLNNFTGFSKFSMNSDNSLYLLKNNGTNLQMIKINADGQQDMSFAGSGIASISSPNGSGDSYIGNIDLKSIGSRPVVYFYEDNWMSGTSPSYLIRLTENGAVDSEFNQGQIKPVLLGYNYPNVGLSINATTGNIALLGQAYSPTWEQVYVMEQYYSELTNGPVISNIPKEIIIGNNFTPQTVGGTGPYSYSLITGTGNIDPVTGVFTPGNNSGEVVIKVVDSEQKESTYSIMVYRFILSPRTAKVGPGMGITLQVSGNPSGSLVYSMLTNGSQGSVSNLGIYTSGMTTGGTDVIKAMDSSGNSFTVNVEVKPVPVITDLYVPTETNQPSIYGSIYAQNEPTEISINFGNVCSESWSPIQVSMWEPGSYEFTATGYSLNTTVSVSIKLKSQYGQSSCYTRTFVHNNMPDITSLIAEQYVNTSTTNLRVKLKNSPTQYSVAVGSSCSGGDQTMPTAQNGGEYQIPVTGLQINQLNNLAIKVKNEQGESNCYQLEVAYCADGQSYNGSSCVAEIPTTKISLNSNKSCALEGDAVKCWGSAQSQYLVSPTVVTGLESGVIDITSKGANCAIKTGGAVYCWSDTMVAQLIPGLESGVSRVDSSGGTHCAIQSGALYCWGYNAYGLVGQNTTESQVSNYATPQLVISSGVTYVDMGQYHACIIQSGILKCWGYNGWGQMGLGQNNGSTVFGQYSLPTNTSLTSGVGAIGLGHNHTCAVHNGALKCWGYNSGGQVNVDRNHRYTPTAIAGLESGVTQVVGGGDSSCAVQNGAAKCWGWQGNGLMGNGLSSNTPTAPVIPAGLSSGVTYIAGGSQQHHCAVKNGSVYCWGGNGYYGQLGNRKAYTSNSELTPIKVLMSPAKQWINP